MNRDPRVDPQAGDVVEGRVTGHRRIVVRRFDDGSPRVTYRPAGGLPRTCNLGTWIRWARRGVVVAEIWRDSEDFEVALDQVVDAFARATGHTPHCVKRLSWGDGECSCPRRHAPDIRNQTALQVLLELHGRSEDNRLRDQISAVRAALFDAFGSAP